MKATLLAGGLALACAGMTAAAKPAAPAFSPVSDAEAARLPLPAAHGDLSEASPLSEEETIARAAELGIKITKLNPKRKPNDPDPTGFTFVSANGYTRVQAGDTWPLAKEGNTWVGVSALWNVSTQRNGSRLDIRFLNGGYVELGFGGVEAAHSYLADCTIAGAARDASFATWSYYQTKHSGRPAAVLRGSQSLSTGGHLLILFQPAPPDVAGALANFSGPSGDWRFQGCVLEEIETG